MNIKALITTVILGSSSIALASPTVRDHRDHSAPSSTTVGATATVGVNATFGYYQPAPRVRHIRPAPLPLPMPLTWVTLANDTHLSGRTLIKVAPTTRTFTKLQLQADEGRTQIDKVTIVFANGRTQIVKLDTKLSKKHSTLSIDLTGEARSIDRIIVVGRSNGRRAALDVRAI